MQRISGSNSGHFWLSDISLCTCFFPFFCLLDLNDLFWFELSSSGLAVGFNDLKGLL